jgi:hypothetical protein
MVLQEGRLAIERTNPNGGAIALGHPIGCSSARILPTLLHEMKWTGAELGVAAICVGRRLASRVLSGLSCGRSGTSMDAGRRPESWSSPRSVAHQDSTNVSILRAVPVSNGE